MTFENKKSTGYDLCHGNSPKTASNINNVTFLFSSITALRNPELLNLIEGLFRLRYHDTDPGSRSYPLARSLRLWFTFKYEGYVNVKTHRRSKKTWIKKMKSIREKVNFIKSLD